jgi:hypothetical protein
MNNVLKAIEKSGVDNVRFSLFLMADLGFEAAIQYAKSESDEILEKTIEAIGQIENTSEAIRFLDAFEDAGGF